MQVIEWNPDMSVNHKKIDEQHKEIIELTNTLIKNADAKVTSEIISESLENLIKHYRAHFQLEEEFLESQQYSNLRYHKGLHDQFRYDVAMFSKAVLENKHSVTEDMIKYLVDWVYSHVFGEDQEYKKYLSK